jgi:hypothetical protein
MAKASNPLARHPRCAVCKHEERHRIELLRARGASLVSLATQFDLHRDALWRHWQRHVDDDAKARLIAGPVPLAKMVERAAAESISVLDWLSVVRSTLMSQMADAAIVGDKHGTASLAGRLLECLRQISTHSGEMNRIGSVHLTNNFINLSSPLMVDLQDMLLRVLAPYPDALAAVIAGMADLSQHHSSPSALKTIEARPAEHVHAA